MDTLTADAAVRSDQLYWKNKVLESIDFEIPDKYNFIDWKEYYQYIDRSDDEKITGFAVKYFDDADVSEFIQERKSKPAAMRAIKGAVLTTDSVRTFKLLEAMYHAEDKDLLKVGQLWSYLSKDCIATDAWNIFVYAMPIIVTYTPFIFGVMLESAVDSPYPKYYLLLRQYIDVRSVTKEMKKGIARLVLIERYDRVGLYMDDFGDEIINLVRKFEFTYGFGSPELPGSYEFLQYIVEYMSVSDLKEALTYQA